MKTLKDVDLKGKKVVLRAEFNVPVEDGKILDDIRIVEALATIKQILSKEPLFLVIMAHLGRPEGRVMEEFSNKIVLGRLEELLGEKVALIEDLDLLEKFLEEEQENSRVLLLENMRFWKQEEENDESFGRRIGELFDVYVNDCFSTSHRAHASFVTVPQYAKERVMGLLFEEEYNKLSKIKDNPRHPAVMVIGGAKIETKLPVIENMVKIYDKVLVGGMIANEAIDQGINLGEKVQLPVDFSPQQKADRRLDIGPETTEIFEREIANAETIVWNGPLGKFEDEETAEGTRRICQAIAKNSGAMQVIGGGETLEAARKFGDFSDFDYVSMSGGAMLDFLAGETLPGLEALER